MVITIVQYLTIKLQKLPHKLQIQFLYNCIAELESSIHDVEAVNTFEAIEKWLKGVVTDVHVVTLSNRMTISSSINRAIYECTCTVIQSDLYGNAIACLIIVAIASIVPLETYIPKLNNFISNLTEFERRWYNLDI